MSIPINDLNPGDVFQDPQGDLWVVRWICSEPMIGMQKIWDGPGQMLPPPAVAGHVREGGHTGLMWRGFIKITARQGPQSGGRDAQSTHGPFDDRDTAK